MGGAGWFFLIIFLILLVWTGWFGGKLFSARKNGDTLNFKNWHTYVPFAKTSTSTSNYPTPRAAGPVEWIKDQINKLRNKRTTSGGYEDTRGGEGAYQNLAGSGGRGRGGRDPDDPWDSRVGGRDEDPYGPGPGGYNEEAELGLAPTPGVGAGHTRNESGPYGAGGDYLSGSTSYGGVSRGRSGERDAGHLDPFSDANQASSMRSVSPRPEGPDTNRPQTHKRLESYDDGGETSPISTRKSVFREDVS
ncbi:hypothetical protein LTR70_006974 [Exophiala xenobiotica]|uniref:Uncharacterized protein n=1 Tax=Lithohypha guttulata TaxID=1690604 RepID=A0ABR0K5U8_9EURO|nr:hypothetical protein LTR24_006486 [Lithohypha guttulata]KAK5314861.1 hypothetical protein LTR70_006974 [Exophiala xenobiotica]